MAIAINVRGSMDRMIAAQNANRREVLEKAVPRALNRVGAMAITQASRELRDEGYNFKASEIKAAMSQRKASASNLVTTIKVRRKTKSLMEFNPRETKAGVMVRIHGQAKLIKGAFIGQRMNGASGVFVADKSAGAIVVRRQKQYKRGSRGGWLSVPVRKLYGPSVGGAYANEKVQQVMRRFIAEKFEARLTHEIKNLSR